MANETVTQGGAAGHTPEPGHEMRHEASGEFQGSAASRSGREVDVRGGNAGAVQQRRQSGLGAYGRDPLFAMVQRLSDEMDELFGSIVYGRPVSRTARQQPYANLWAPEVEISQEAGQLRVCVDLPGVQKDNVSVDVNDGTLTIQGERREERTEGGEQQGYRRSERRYGSFYRTIPLPEGANGEEAQARMKDGVLEIVIPVTPPKQGKRLEIRS